MALILLYRYEFITDCWVESPGKRPSFVDLTQTINSLLEGVAGYMDLSAFHNESADAEDSSADSDKDPPDTEDSNADSGKDPPDTEDSSAHLGKDPPDAEDSSADSGKDPPAGVHLENQNREQN